jgi:N-terminal TM domain of oligopeptide transport permease C
MNGLARVWDSDVAYSFRHSPVAMVAALTAFVLIFAAVFAYWVAPHNPFDLATINLLDACRRHGRRAGTRSSGSGPTIRGATSSPPSSTACRSRC